MQINTIFQNNWSRKNTKAALKIATLNIRRYCSAEVGSTETKWNYINQVIRDKRLGILLVQETHLIE